MADRAAKAAPKKASARKKPAKKAVKRTAKTAARTRRPAAKRARPAPATRPRPGASKPPATAGPRSAEGASNPPAAPAVAPVVQWQPVPEPQAWLPVEETPMPQPRPTAAAPAPPPFNPVTGDWLPVAPEPALAVAAPSEDMAPDAPKKSVGAIVWTVILAIDLALLALNFLAQLVVGAVLVFFPDSAQAEDLRSTFEEGGTRAALVLQTLVVFVMMGVIPFLWVLATRRVPWEGARRYLHLHSPGKGILQGIALTPVLLIAVIALSSLYILITEGVEGFSLSGNEGDNPAVEALLAQLTWPIAFLVAIVAGVGEEILFRGVLQRRIGLWWQAILFGLAHSYGGYIPQILFALGLGVFFGYLVRRGWSLWALMTAHFLYDFVLLSLALVYG